MGLRGVIPAGVVVVLAWASAAQVHGFAHEWRITEIYSNAAGNVQYIEMHSPIDFEHLLNSAGMRFSSNSGIFFFPNDLPPETGNKSLLMATADFAAIPGAVTPDYTIPANFISTSGDTLVFSEATFQWDVFSFSAGQLPLDGIHALDRSSLQAVVNSPTNFAGESGFVPEPAAIVVLLPMLVLIGSRRRAGQFR